MIFVVIGVGWTIFFSSYSLSLKRLSLTGWECIECVRNLFCICVSYSLFHQITSHRIVVDAKWIYIVPHFTASGLVFNRNFLFFFYFLFFFSFRFVSFDLFSTKTISGTRIEKEWTRVPSACHANHIWLLRCCCVERGCSQPHKIKFNQLLQ